MKKTVAVVGVGSAGLQTLCHLCTWLDNTWKIISIHNPEIKAVGVGESTQPPFLGALRTGIDFNVYDHLDPMKATIKVGSVFKKWRKHSFINPLFAGSIALHIDTNAIKDFILPRLKERWPVKLEVKEQDVQDLNALDYDYIVDCRGYPTDFSEYIKPPAMLINHALIHSFKRPGTTNYTGQTATPDGWMFDIPLPQRHTYGYLYCDKITSQSEAKKNFSKILKVPLSQLDKTEFSFPAYYAKTVFDGRIFKNGNRAFLFEPISALSLYIYNKINQLVVSGLYRLIPPSAFNKDYLNAVERTRDMIYYYYHGGSTFSSKFWKKAQAQTSKELKKSEHLQKAIHDFRYHNALGTPAAAPAWFYESSSMKQLDKDFGYNYFQV